MGMIAEFTTYTGTKSSNTTTVQVYVDIVDSGNKVTATVYCRAKMKSGYWVQSSGLMFNASATGHQATSNKSICGNTFKVGSGEKQYGGTWFSSGKVSFSWDKNTSLATKTITVNVYRSTDMSSNGLAKTTNTTTTIPLKNVDWKINTKLDGIVNNKLTTFTLKVGGKVTTALSGAATYNSDLEISNLSFEDKYQLVGVNNTTLSNNIYKKKLNSASNDIIINLTYKNSKLTLDSQNYDMTYNSIRNNKVIAPQRIGYEFLGWFDDGGNQVYDATGNYVQGVYWDTNGRYLGTQNISLKAYWELKNVVYIKDIDNQWKLAMVHIKNEKWEPAILYTKIDNNWQQSID